MKTSETASLILSALLADDAQTARELADAIGTTAAALRPALRQLVEAGDVVTSGRAGGTRYVLAVVEQVEAPVQPVELVVSAAVEAQRAERSSTASLVLAEENEPAGDTLTAVLNRLGYTHHPRENPGAGGREVRKDGRKVWEGTVSDCWSWLRETGQIGSSARKPRTLRPIIPATVDVLGALQATQQRLESGASLAELSARPALVREVPATSRAAAEQAQQERDAWTAEQDASIARRATRRVLSNLTAALVVLAPVAWVLAHLVR